MVEYTGAVGCSPEKDDENVGDVLVRVLQGKVIIGDIQIFYNGGLTYMIMEINKSHICYLQT